MMSRPPNAASESSHSDWRIVGQLAAELFDRLGHVHGMTKTDRPLLGALARLYRGADLDAVVAKAGALTAYQLGLLRRCDALLHHVRSPGPKEGDELNVAGRLLDLVRLADELASQGDGLKLIPCLGPKGLQLLARVKAAHPATLHVPGWVDGLQVTARMPRCAEPPAPQWAVILCRWQGRHFFTQLGGLASQDEEYVHELRVALRRLRSAIKVFAKVLPDSLADVQPDLRQWSAALSPVRDEDSFRDFLSDHMRRHPSSAPTLGPLLEHVRRRRRGLLADARRFFASPLFFRQRRQLEAHLARARHGPAPHLSALAKRQVNKRLAKVLEFPTDLESLSESRFHQLRIACKRLRYCCEFFQPVDPKTLGDLAKAARKMQTCIGEHRDAGLFLERVRAWQVRPSRPRSGKPMERLIQALEQVRKRRLAQAQQEWRKLRRGRAGRKGRVQLHVAHPWDLRETVVI